jgi:LPPG:FO 2-phospho-L-lactate transferase
LVVLLAGGTGGAKLARGMLDAVGPERLAVIANTADDVEVYGVHVSPDPDLVTYWLADEIDDRGWGLRGDTWKVMDALESGGRPPWFRLGDRDLAMCLLRTAALRAGARLTEAHSEVVRAMGVCARVLPMSDDEVRTWVRTATGWRAFQEFMIVDRTEPEIEEVAVRGADTARPAPEVLDALAHAEAVVIGPSNPVISIGPILAVGGMREAIAAAGAPVVAVSPFVGGRAVKGPTEAFVRQAGLPLAARTLAELYGNLLHGIVADEDASEAGLPAHVTDTLMDDAAARERVARETLEFAESLPR